MDEINYTGVALPDGITLQQLNDWQQVARTQYTPAYRKMKRVDALDRNKLWDAIAARFPKYQLLPQTNHVSYVKNNILANVYTVGKSAQLQFTSEQDKDLVYNLNVALEHIWDNRNVADYQLEAGERAALLNLGITQVGWDNSIVSGKDDNFSKGQVVLKNVDPMQYMRDPFAEDLDHAAWVCTWAEYHKSVLEASDLYSKEFKKFDGVAASQQDYVIQELLKMTDSNKQTTKQDYHKITIWYVRDGKNIHEIHVCDDKCVLAVKKNIKPAMFPFAELYCNLPAGDLVGTSECMKVTDNSIVYNLMNSIVATAEYKNQRPPRFVNAASGINVNAFTKYGNDADRTFVINGDASQAVQYHQFPVPSPQAMTTMGALSQDIQQTSGVDGKYTGRDTGSVITTGGVESVLSQATAIDMTRIMLYEKYCKKLSQLIIFNYIEHSAVSRRYVKQLGGGKYTLVNVDFPSIPSDIVFEYDINISSEMPKNKQRMAEAANEIMQMQMQYKGQGIDVDLITPQEWLMFQDIPNKEYFEERMNVQRTQNWNSIVAEVVSQYAALLDAGMQPADAINATAQTMQAEQRGQEADMNDVALNSQLFG